MMPVQHLMSGQQMAGGQSTPGHQPVGMMPSVREDRPNHMVMPPASFPALDQAPEDQMSFMLENTQLLDDWIVTLPDVKAIEERTQKTRAEQGELAEQILSKEGE